MSSSRNIMCFLIHFSGLFDYFIDRTVNNVLCKNFWAFFFSYQYRRKVAPLNLWNACTLSLLMNDVIISNLFPTEKALPVLIYHVLIKSILLLSLIITNSPTKTPCWLSQSAQSSVECLSPDKIPSRMMF